MTQLEVTILGRPSITQVGKSFPSLVSRKSRALICYLAFTGRPHSRQALAGLFWSEMSEQNARRNLRVILTKLRTDFDDYLIIQRRTLAFNRERPFSVDALLFEEELSQKDLTIQQLKQTTDRYREPFMHDFALRDAPLFEEWVRLQQEHYRQMAMAALFQLSASLTEARQFGAGIETLSRLLQLEPWMEEAHRQRMLLLALSGQRSAALAQYETCVAMLREELGVDPSPETTQLYGKIRDRQLAELAQALQVVSSPDSRPQLPPFQIPVLAAHFVGRRNVQSKMQQALRLQTGRSIHAIVGMGGVGKSTLAATVATEVQGHFIDGVLWADMATGDPVAIMENWARLYGYDFSRVNDLEKMSLAFRGVLAGKRVLMVLDDVTSFARIRPLLPEEPQCRVLITTRDEDVARALKARIWQLRELTPANGRRLMEAILGTERTANEATAVHTICDLLQNLPLALEITAQRLKSRPRRRLADIAERLQDESNRLSLLAASDGAVRASFQVSWEALDSERQQIFRLLGLFNGRSFTAEALAHIVEMARFRLEDRLFDLINLSLLRETAERRYQQHPLLADFAREQMGEDVAVENGRFATYYLHFAQQHPHDYDALRPEWDNMMAAMETAHTCHHWQTVIDFAHALHDAWFARGRYTQARQGYKWHYEAARALDHRMEIASSLRFLALACVEQREYGQAEKHLTASLQSFQEQADLLNIAKTNGDFAKLMLEIGNYQETRNFIANSLACWHKVNDVKGIAETYYMEARLAYFEGKYELAVEVAEKGLKIQQDIDDHKGALLTLSLAASALNEMERYSHSEHYALLALKLSHQLQDKSEESMILDVLAGTYIGQKKFDLAETHAQQSLDLLKGMGDLRSQAQVLHRLSLIQQGKGDLDKALQSSQRSLALCRKVDYPLLMAPVLMYLGDFQKQVGDLNQAKRTWQEAMEIADLLQHPKLRLKLQQRLR